MRINFQKIFGQAFSDDKLGSCGLYDKKTGRLITKSALQGADPNWIVFPMVETAVVQWFQSIDTVHEVQVKVVSDSADDSVPKPLISNTTNGNSDGVFMVVYTDGRQLQEVEYYPFLGRWANASFTQSSLSFLHMLSVTLISSSNKYWHENKYWHFIPETHHISLFRLNYPIQFWEIIRITWKLRNSFPIHI